MAVKAFGTWEWNAGPIGDRHILTFTDASVGAITSWLWEIHDSTTQTSTDQNPVFDIGTGSSNPYIILTVSDGVDTDTVRIGIWRDYINNPIDFSWTGVVSTTSSTTFTPSGYIAPPVTTSWNFNGHYFQEDNVNPATAWVALGTYFNVGINTVTATAFAGPPLAEASSTRYIPVYGPPNTDFTFLPSFGSTLSLITFTDITSNTAPYSTYAIPASWAWTFGDGETSTDQNPTHTYAAEGTYTVTLTATNAYGSTAMSHDIVITNTPPEADFGIEDNPSTVNTPIHFRDRSRHQPTSWSWNFGDGGTSTEQHPTHTYLSLLTPHGGKLKLGGGGTRTVTLDVSNPLGSGSTARSLFLFPAGTECLYVSNGHKVQLLKMDGTLVDVAGNGTSSGTTNAVGDSARFNTPSGVCQSPDGLYVYVADQSNNLLRKITVATREVTTLAGSGTNDTIDDTGLLAAFYYPMDVSCDADGNIWVVQYDGILRKVTPAGVVTTVLSDTTNHVAWGITLGADGNIYYADQRDNTLGKVTPAGVISIYAGISSPSSPAHVDGGPGVGQFNNAIYDCVENSIGDFYVSEAGSALRKVDTALNISTLADSMTANFLACDSADNIYACTGMSIKKLVADAASTFTSGGVGFNGFNGISNGVEPPAPIASFTEDLSLTNVGVNITFTDTSTGTPNQWAWDFGNGDTSADQNPVYAYPTDGTFTVTLVITDAYSRTDTVTHSVVIVPVGAPLAEFSFTPLSPVIGDTITFTDLSTNTPTAWLWNFDDGASTSTLQNPTYVYAVAGTYHVTLTASNVNGGSTTAQNIIVTVPSGPPPVAEFSFAPTNQLVFENVNFTDLSTNTPTSWAWTFGDGGTSTEQNPAYAYSLPGLYDVSLTATNINGFSTVTHTVDIPNIGCPIFPQLPDGAIGMPYSNEVLSTNGSFNYFDVSDPTLKQPPDGLKLFVTFGVIRHLFLVGTPTVCGYFTFEFDASNDPGYPTCDGRYTSSIYIYCKPVILTDVLTNSNLCKDAPYSFSVIVLNGKAPYLYSYTGSLPPGMSLNIQTGEIHGRPILEGTYVFTLFVNDILGLQTSKTYTLTVVNCFSDIKVYPSHISETVIVKDNFHQKYLYDYIPYTIKDIKDV